MREVKRYHLTWAFLSDPANSEGLLIDLVSGDFKVDLAIDTNVIKQAYQILKIVDQVETEVRPLSDTLTSLRIYNHNPN